MREQNSTEIIKEDSDPRLNPFAVFCSEIKPCLLVNHQYLPLMRKIYALAKQKVDQEDQKEVAKADAKRLRSAVDLYDRACAATRNSRRYIEKALQILPANADISPSVSKLEDIKARLDAVEEMLQARSKAHLAGIHPKFRRRKETPPRWKSLLSQHYEMPHFRSRATDHWFFRELDSLLLSSGVKTQEMRHAIICDAMQAAFNQNWTTDAIKVAIYRSARMADAGR